ncbi:unnamed protein product [Bemisia tabaci]|uniref:Tetratricopeptide repeat protein 36 n=1 Tax=Bemisia tabaci TaxID=7038 RepID=A0A9P0A5E1_BEMTA|nr:unnamed protein product [Bemisia tabaci]
MTTGISDNDRAVLNAILNPNLPMSTPNDEELMLRDTSESEQLTPSICEAKERELEGIKKAEMGELDDSIRLLTESIDIASRASAFNNRAQVHRLKGDTSAAMQDLRTAIDLSKGTGRAGCQAFCQRGILYLCQGKDSLAKQDFESAAKLGSQFAKTQLVQMNPYAAMCNQMLHQIVQMQFFPPSQE